MKRWIQNLKYTFLMTVTLTLMAKAGFKLNACNLNS